MDPISWSFIRFQCILDDSGVLSSESSNVQKLKRCNLISGGNQFCRRSELFGPLFCISILNFLWTQIHLHPLDFNAFWENQEYFSESLEMNRNERGATQFLGGTNFAESLNYLVPPFCISILKVLRTQIHGNSLDFNVVCMIQQYFSQSLEVSTN